MKNFITGILLCGLLSSTVALASQETDHIKRTLKNISDYDNPKGSIGEGLEGRGKYIAALTLGTQAGLYYESKRLNRIMAEQYADYFDSIFAFNRFLIKTSKYTIMPPVIDEYNGSLTTNKNGSIFRAAEKTWKIRKNAKFVLTPPTWRTYMLLTEYKPDYATAAKFAPTADEQEAWDQGVDKGFAIGVKQARSSMSINLAKAANDIQGLLRYQLLRKYNIVSEPEIKEIYTPVAGGGSKLSIADSVISITVNPALNSNRYEWKAIPVLPDISAIFPNGIFEKGVL